MSIQFEPKNLMLHPLMVHKWKLNSWTAGSVENSQALVDQAISFKLIKSPTRFKSGKMEIVFEEDINGDVAMAIERLKGRSGNIVITVIGNDDVPAKTIELIGVKIKNHSFYMDYAVSATHKANLACSFKRMVIY